jgi:adenylate cyclase
MKRDRNNENVNENDERDTSDNLKRKLEKIHQEERSIDTENNNQEGENDIKEKIIKRMIDTNYNTSSKTERQTKENTKGSSTENKTVYDLQTLLSQRQDRLTSLLYERYQYNTSIKRGPHFLLNHVDSKLSLVVMYSDLVGSTKMSMTLPVERMAKIIKAYSHELSSVVESYDGFVLKYVGDAVIAFFPSGFNKYLSCDKAFQCATSMINVIVDGINPILEKDKDNYPKLAVKIGIDEVEKLAIQY